MLLYHTKLGLSLLSIDNPEDEEKYRNFISHFVFFYFHNKRSDPNVKPLAISFTLHNTVHKAFSSYFLAVEIHAFPSQKAISILLLARLSTLVLSS